MTARQVYEGVLIEMNKVLAPSLLLEDFNYLFNKAINQYINKRYNIYDVNQQTTDDIRVLKASAVLRPIKSFTSGLNGHASGIADDTLYGDGITGQNTSSPYGTVYDVTGMNSLYGATYEAYLPMDYLHLLSCICNFRVNKTFKCYDKGTFMQFAALRLTSDAWSTIINNFYMRPSYKRPYYYIHNVNTKRDVPTNPSRATSAYNGSDLNLLSDYTFTSSEVIAYVSGLEKLGVNVNTVYIKKTKDSVTTYTAIATLKSVNTTADSTNKITLSTGTTVDGRAISGIVYSAKQSDGTYSDLTCAVSTAGAITTTTLTNITLETNESLVMKAYTGDYILVTNVVVKLNTNNYVRELASIGVTNTGNDMDAIGVDGNASAGYTYGKYTNTETGSPTGVSNFPRTITIGDGDVKETIDVVERPAALRFGNSAQVRLEIRYGKDDSLFELVSVYVDYIKVPQYIRLTQEQLDLTEDTSLIMEFPDYVCQEIINELVHIFMENGSDPRLPSHASVSQSIANPAQALTSQALG